MKKYFGYLLIIIFISFLSIEINFAQTTENDTSGYFVNVRPLKDFAALYKRQILDKHIDSNAPFKIEVFAKLDESGKLTDAGIAAKDGSPEMLDIAKDAVSAVSDSGMMKPLYDLGARDVKIIFSQDKNNFQAIIQMPMPTPEKARTTTSGLNLLFSSLKILRKGTDEAAFAENVQLSTLDKTTVINFVLPQAEKNKLLEKYTKDIVAVPAD